MSSYSISDWSIDTEGRVTAVRESEFSIRLSFNRIICTLCFLHCEIKEGQSGHCKYRVNKNGNMMIPFHGENTCMIEQHRGYAADPFLFYKPGVKSLMLGGTYCTAKCTFCMSKEITWNPISVPWTEGYEKCNSRIGARYSYKAMLHPKAAIYMAKEWGCNHIEFGINEPTLSWEYTYDVARLAKEEGMDVVIESNGFTSSEAIRKLAPFIDSIQIGVKGSCGEDFYNKYVRTPGGSEAVKKAIKEWKDSGVHVIIGDVVAPPHMQDNTIEVQKRFYSWVHETIGADTPVLICPLYIPGPLGTIKEEDGEGYLTKTRGNQAEEREYIEIIYKSLYLGKEIGLHYTHIKSDHHVITCRVCGETILHITHPNHVWQHEIYVTNGKCNHCGAKVPIVDA
jgi:pyruvate formate lyase activating enzyme